MGVATAMQWRECPRFPDYEVSECGDLRRKLDSNLHQRGRVLKGVIDPDGYIHYTLRRRDGGSSSATAHRLVAEAFIGPAPSPQHEVAHNNGSKLLNTQDNLRWAIPLSNQRDRAVHGTDAKGTRNGRAQITDDDVRYIRRRYREIKLSRGRVAELDEQFNLSRGQIIRIARGEAWSHVQ